MGAEHDRLGPPDAVVRLVPGTDLASAKLSAAEGFVLSRVDGTSSLQTICLVTGLGEAQTLDILSALKAKRMITVGDGEASPAEASPPLQQVDTLVDSTPLGLEVEGPRVEAPEPEPEPEPEPGPEPEPVESRKERRGDEEDGGEWQDSDTDEECELKPPLRKQIRELYSRIGQLNLFDLLGVQPDAGIKQIRKAFFIKSKVYHPDRYFGRKLGPYGEMLHEIFKQMNSGYKMLCDTDKLAQYREMVLQQQEQERLAREVERQAADYLQEEERLEPTDGPPGGDSAAAPKRSGTFRAHRAKALMDLVGQRRNGQGPPPPEEPPERRVRRQSDHRLRTKRVTGALFSRAKKAQQFYFQGKQQLERGQYLAATASLKLAMTYNREERQYAEAFALASAKAAELTAENFFKRGMMEESVGRFDAAAGSFVAAAEQNPKAAYLMKAAEAMLWSHDADDLISAKNYATKAVQADPNSVDVRLVAARVYRAAGMKRNARRELQMALKIEPGNPDAKELLKGV